MARRRIPSRQNIDIFCDLNFCDDVYSPRHGDTHPENTPTQTKHPLDSLAVSQAQNRQFEQLCLETRKSVPSSPVSSDRPSYNFQKESKRRGSRAASKLTRPSISANTFDFLDPVLQSGSQHQQAGPAASSVSNEKDPVQHLTDHKFSTHPLTKASHNVPSIDEQVAKHRDEQFELLVAFTVPNQSESQSSLLTKEVDQVTTRKAYFGLNLLPKPHADKLNCLGKSRQLESYSLLMTPVATTKEVLEVFQTPIADLEMASPIVKVGHPKAIDIADQSSTQHEFEQGSPKSVICTTKIDKHAATATSMSPAGKPVARIEDSFEALDELEEQLEAFDEIARLKTYMSKDAAQNHSPTVRFATPQPKTSSIQTGSASLRVKPVLEPRRHVLRKSTSTHLDSLKSKVEEKGQIQTTSAERVIKGVASPSTARPSTKPSKQSTVRVSEIPGDSASRQLKEKMEAHLSATVQRATQPTASSLRRAKSAKLPTRPQFELPGEAISRRKREEREAQLKAQEEEEKKRREFKARPLPSNMGPGTVPRATVASRARQQNKTLSGQTENSRATPSQRPATLGASSSRPALFTASNQLQPRGRGTKADETSPILQQSSRATSTSTNSISKRSSISLEDMHLQKLRGQEIYQRDNSWSGERMRERREREGLAKLARDAAAEESRLKSREWAAKQAKKRATIGSLRDILS